jgi:DNA-binding transcriptional LysR family regulator
MEMIELRHLRYFIAVAEEGHITRAAARLGIQQPPLSQQIRALETEVGVTLLTRMPRGVELTEAGRVFLGEARAVLAQMAHAVDAAQRTARGEQGQLAIGFTGSAAFHPLIPAVVRAFREQSRVPVGDTTGLVIEPLLDEPMLLALPAHHPLLRGGKRKRIALAELAEETFILYRRPTGPGLYDAIIAACRTAGFSPHIGQEAPRMVSTLSFVAAGLGVSIVPESMRRLNTEGIAYLALSDAISPVAPLLLAWRAAPVSGAMQNLIAHVRRMAGPRR